MQLFWVDVREVFQSQTHQLFGTVTIKSFKFIILNNHRKFIMNDSETDRR